MCVSAIPVIARTLLDMNLLHRNVGQLILIAGMVDDAVGWAMLAIVSAMAAGVVSPGAVLLSAASLAGVVLFAFTAGRTLVRLPMRMARRADGPGASVSVVVFLILLSAAGTQALGLEAVFGAFLCGIVISVSGQVPAAGLAPLRTVVLSVFAPIFFAGAGMRMDLTALARPAVLLTGLVSLFIAVAGKFVGAFAGARLSRLTRWEAVALGAGLNARGVIEVVVAMVGLRLGILSVEAYTIIVMIAIVTSLMAPPLLRLVMPRIEHTDEEVLREQAHRAWSTTASGTVIPAA
jgi:Kef-type K+ transport system membrane component KefB